jgi:exopolysaccharide biosynthesis operon protein EpsL
MLNSYPNRLSRRHPRHAAAPRLYRLALLIGALCCASAKAGPNDALHLYGGLGYGHDDNLLRVPDGEPAFDNTLGDSWTQAEGGLIFDKTYSRQKLFAQAKLSKVKFDHFKQLDYDGKDLLARWDWQLGNHLEGKLGASYNQTLAPYTDFHSNERNLRQQRRTFFEGAWRFHPSWRARTAASRDKYTYELLVQRFNDRTEDAAEVGADYLAASGSTVGLVARKVKGKYPNRRPIGQQLLTDDYDQDELKARIEWLASGNTTVQALGGWVRRKQAAFGDDSSGFNGRVSAIYDRGGKTTFNAAVWRDFAPIESTLVSYTLNKGASAGATWNPTAKIRLDANATYERRAFNPRLAALAMRADLNDSIRSATLSATYSPLRSVQLSAALTHQGRSGSPFLGTGQFSSNAIVLNATAQF